MNSTWFHVGVLYAAAVWLARRWGSTFPWRIAALFYALVLIFLWAPLTGPYVNIPVDIAQPLPPWSASIRYHRAANFELNDIVMQIVPWAHQVREAWKSFHFPLWNSLSGSGYPLLANGQSSGLSPIRFLALPLPLGYSFTAEAAMKILIAMSFMYAFCRRRWSELASAFGAICFGYCTFVQTWLHFPLVTVGVFLPAAFLTLDLLIERVTWPRFVATVAVWSVMLLGGHPETVAHIFFLICLYLLFTLIRSVPLPSGEGGAQRRVRGEAKAIANWPGPSSAALRHLLPLGGAKAKTTCIPVARAAGSTPRGTSSRLRRA